MNNQTTLPPVPQGATAPGFDAAGGEVDLRELIGILVHGRWLLGVVFLLAMLLAGAYLAVAEPIYEVDALVQVETETKNSINAALGDVAELLGGEVEITSEIEILRSRMVVGRVVSEMGLELRSEPVYFPLLGRAYARLFAPADGSIAEPPGGLTRYAWGGERVELGRLEVPPVLLGRRLTLRVLKNGYALFDEHEEKLLTGQLGVLASAQSRYGPIELFVKDVDARPRTEFRIVRHATISAIEALQRELKVSERGKNSGILAVSFEAPNAVFAAEVVNRIVAAYQRQNVERKSAEAAQTLQFLENQLPKLKGDVEAAEAALNQYRLKRGSADLPKETELILQQSVQLETQKIELQQKREEALRRFTPDHPTLKVIQAQLGELGKETDRIGRSVKSLPETQQELLSLSRDLHSTTHLYTTLLNNAQQLQVVKAGTIGNVRIVDPAIPTIEPAKPQKTLILGLGAILGLMLGVVAVFIRRALHAGVEDPAQIERELGITAYASVPYVREQRLLERAMMRSRTSAQSILAQTDPENVAVEALRGLRTSLHFGMLEAENNMIVMTGPEPHIGKSFITINFGAVLALGGKRVLVVDMDLRRGRLHQYVGSDRAPGLTEFIADGDMRVVRKTSIEGLDLITSGTLPPNPAELLMHERTVNLLRSLSKQYDYVLIDTPPILPVTDAALIGRLAGTTLLVLKSGEHPIRMIEESLRRLNQGGVQVRGTIFNQIGVGGTAGYGYRYGYSPVYYRYSRNSG
jgi:tyrosine-protein kinase Etk/Wzc